jgi:hypothetical protein
MRSYPMAATPSRMADQGAGSGDVLMTVFPAASEGAITIANNNLVTGRLRASCNSYTMPNIWRALQESNLWPQD